jgi:hypothetical protein
MFFAILFSMSIIPTDAPAKPALPVEWHGRWTGTLKVNAIGGKEQETQMELLVEPLKSRTGYRWRITYGEPKVRPARDYELIPQEKNGHFVIDEKNGIVIDAWLVGGTIHSQFQVGESMIPVRYELKGDTLVFSLVVYTSKDARTTKLTRGEMEAKAFQLQTVQTAELKKAKAE